MATPSDITELVGYVADPRLLDTDPALLPAGLGRPAPLPASRARGPVVAGGVVMTGLTLLGGVALIAIALVSAFSDGADLADGILLALGFLLVGTHWGWVHVAEMSATTIDSRRARDVVEARQDWLRSIAPYTRDEVLTEVEDDGSIAILTVRHLPVRCGEGRFVFEREVLAREVHSEEEPAAAVTERAERLRGEAAETTSRARERFLAAAEAHQTSLLRAAGEHEERQLRRASSGALSDQINANLRNPPVDS